MDQPEPETRCNVTFVDGDQCARPAGHADGLHMPLETWQTHERRVRWEAAARTAKRPVDRAALRAYMAVADEEQQEMANAAVRFTAAIRQENARLRAELDQARAITLTRAADRIDAMDLPQDHVDMFDNGARWATAELRSMARTVEQPGPVSTDGAQQQ
ncbi:hypothetical protein ACFRKB_11270 [Streptomyces scopuliridis]|uniref:hypothetical protein n=1 Tax=Streptomyces scopuliridis TaxID=452529 RepID=UPI0036B49F64